MRPLPGDDAFTGRSRSTSLDNDATPMPTRHAPQMTYFMADEKTMEASQACTSTVLPKQRDISKSSTYGVESLDTTISSLAQDSDDSEDRLRRARHNWKKNLGQLASRNSEEALAEFGSPSLRSTSDNSRNASPSHQRRSSQATISRPFTPLSFPGGPTSIMSSPRSRRNSGAGSDMDDIVSQAIVSSGDEDRDTRSELLNSGGAPQLVMPSIKMPSRRPFTENGKNMGRLKVLVAGDSGVGKTSLIKAIVQICEDIVHVDPISANPISIPEPRRKNSSKSRSRSTDTQSTSQITEIYASTKAYPAWWSDLEESRILRRRKSMGDSVLERNLCFVDTPGYGNKTSCLECITPVVDYIESRFKKAAAFDGLTESEIVNMLSGNGGPQVDLVFYIIMNNIKPVDIEYLKRLSNLTNVIPLIARADTHSTEHISMLKEQILSELNANDIRPFIFGIPSQITPFSSIPSAPYAVSTSPSKDDDNMDASLLMSPDYVQPLAQSELQPLIHQIFERDAIAWLRHSASKKFLTWRSSSTPLSRPQSLYRPLPSPSTSQSLTGPVGAMTSYALARITDHTQREERIAQVRLANWAADLQLALQKERLDYEAKARGERAVWLAERLGECVQDGTLVPISKARKDNPAFDQGSGTLIKQSTYSRRREIHQDMQDMLDRRDPLGLLKMNDDFKRRGWAVVKALSLLGLVGGIAGFASWFSRQLQAANVTDGTFYGLGLGDWIEFGRIGWRA